MGEREQDEALAREQRRHWQRTYAGHPDLYGDEPSAPAVYAAELFRRTGAHEVLELGAGHGRDALYFAREGFAVHATDFSAEGLEQLSARAAGSGLSVTTTVHDVRETLPLPDASEDGVFAHMLLCMALSTEEIHALVTEVRRVLRPGGAFVYSVRHIGDAHYGAGCLPRRRHLRARRLRGALLRPHAGGGTGGGLGRRRRVRLRGGRTAAPASWRVTQRLAG